MIRKKTALILLLTLALAVSSAYARQTVLSEANELRIDLIKYDPSPIEPGKPSDIHFEITNLEEKDWDNFEITLTDGTYKLIDSDTKKLNFGKLRAGERINFKFTVTPDVDIPDGNYKLNIGYKSREAKSFMSEPFTIKVQRVNRYVSATTTKVTATADLEQGMLTQGGTSELTLTLHNPADYTMRDITVSLDLSSDSIPIAPLGSTSETKIRALTPGQSSDLKFNLIALPDATSNVYKVPLKITYYDETGNNHTKNDLIGLVIDGKPEIHIEIKNSELQSGYGTGEITLNFVNKGLAKVKFLTVQLEQPKDGSISLLGKKIAEYELLSEDKLYLGDIDPDDDESADFIIKARSWDKKITLPVTLEYRDANNRPHVENREVELEIHTKRELGLEKISKWKFLLLVAALVVFWRYKHWKKSNKGGVSEYLKFLLNKFRLK